VGVWVRRSCPVENTLLAGCQNRKGRVRSRCVADDVAVVVAPSLKHRVEPADQGVVGETCAVPEDGAGMLRDRCDVGGGGLMSRLPLYLRMLKPRKANPSSIGTIRVFSCNNVSARSVRNCSTWLEHGALQGRTTRPGGACARSGRTGTCPEGRTGGPFRPHRPITAAASPKGHQQTARFPWAALQPIRPS
jgi:hypothetical protein